MTKERIKGEDSSNDDAICRHDEEEEKEAKEARVVNKNAKEYIGIIIQFS